MVSLQKNIEYLSNKIQDTLTSHAGKIQIEKDIFLTENESEIVTNHKCV